MKAELANQSNVTTNQVVSSSNDSEYRLIAAYENHPHEEDGLDARSWLNFTEKVILNDNNNLWIYNTKNETLNVLHEAFNSIDSFEALTTESIFLSTFNSTFTTVSSLNRDANASRFNYSMIFEEARVRTRSMVFDHFGENLYIIDESKGTLIVVDVHTKDYNVLLADLIEPSKITLDPFKGVMFILQLSHSVM